MSKELEYQTAQESAQHHDQLVWTTTGILWTGNIILLGFVLSVLGDANPAGRVIPTVLSLLGIFLVTMVWRITGIWRAVKVRKYEACQRLELLLGFQEKHHSEEAKRYPKGQMTCWYGSATIAFVLVWVFVIFAILCPTLRC